MGQSQHFYREEGMIEESWKGEEWKKVRVFGNGTEVVKKSGRERASGTDQLKGISYKGDGSFCG